MQKTMSAFQIFMALLMKPKILKRHVKRMERYAARLEGKKRVLWCLTWGSTGANHDPVSTLWIRYPNSLQECIRLPDISGEHELTSSNGKYADLPQTAQAYFDRYVRPRINGTLAKEAIKVPTFGHCVAASELRDHPFQPGVREFYELTTTYTYTCHTSSGYAPAKYAKFTTEQTTIRVQLKENRLLLLKGKQLWNISAGRLPQIDLSHNVRQGIRTLALELADRKLNAGQKKALDRHLCESPDLPELLHAIRFPDLLHIHGLSEFVRYAPIRERRLALRHQGGVKKLIRKLAGELPAEALNTLNTAAKVSLAISMHRSGITSPDLKLRVLQTAPADTYGQITDFSWYVKGVGETAAAHRMIEALRRDDLALNREAQPLDISSLLHYLRDAGIMYACLTNAGETPKLSGLSIRDLHDQLARLQRRVMTRNQPLPSAADDHLSQLDQTLHCGTFGLLQFRRAKDTHELIGIGEALNNCVASYATAALAGEVIIVVARDALNVPRLCLEVRGRTLLQYKLNFNGRPQQAADIQTAQSYVHAARLRVATADLPGGSGQVRAPAALQAPAGFGDDLPF